MKHREQVSERADDASAAAANGDATAPRDGAVTLDTMSMPAFRSIVAERLRTLERDLGEVRTRVNGLLFVVAGAVVTQVLLRLIG
jgi:hypothetical protein